MNFIQLEGWACAGKGVLWSLLDGHSEIFVCPTHDFSHCVEYYGDIDKFSFRNSLSKTEYYKLEKLSSIGYDPISFGNKAEEKNPFNFNFYEFDRSVSSMILKNEKLKGIDFAKLYARNFIKNYTPNNPELINKKYNFFAAMGNYHCYKRYELTNMIKEIKTIVVIREVEGIVASRVNRDPRDVDSASYKHFSPEFRSLIRKSEVEMICDYNNFMKKLANKYPDNFLIIDFKKLISSHSTQMKKVCNFLDIEFEDILNTPTRDAISIGNEDNSFVGKENDNPNEILTFKEKVIIQIHKVLFNFHKQPFNILNPIEILRFIYRRFQDKKFKFNYDNN
jgi:hypothetical protein